MGLSTDMTNFLAASPAKVCLIVVDAGVPGQHTLVDTNRVLVARHQSVLKAQLPHQFFSLNVQFRLGLFSSCHATHFADLLQRF